MKSFFLKPWNLMPVWLQNTLHYIVVGVIGLIALYWAYLLLFTWVPDTFRWMGNSWYNGSTPYHQDLTVQGRVTSTPVRTTLADRSRKSPIYVLTATVKTEHGDEVSALIYHKGVGTVNKGDKVTITRVIPGENIATHNGDAWLITNKD